MTIQIQLLLKLNIEDPQAQEMLNGFKYNSC